MYNNVNKFDKNKIKKYAFENFSESAFIKKYKEVYEQVLNYQ